MVDKKCRAGRARLFITITLAILLLAAFVVSRIFFWFFVLIATNNFPVKYLNKRPEFGFVF